MPSTSGSNQDCSRGITRSQVVQAAFPEHYLCNNPDCTRADHFIGRVRALEAIAAALFEFGGNLDHSYRCLIRTAKAGWAKGDPPIVRCVCGLADLERALNEVEAL